MALPRVLEYLTFAGIILGAWFYMQGEFANAGDMVKAQQEQAVTAQELFNENRRDRLQAELEQLRARQRAGYVYPDDSTVEDDLIRELERARDYYEKLRQIKVDIK